MHNVSMTELSVLGPPNSSGALTLVEGIQQSLGEAIASGSLPAGFRLREIPLAEHYGCSTTPVREALRRLEHEGLVKVHARRGAEVTSVSADEVDHLYEARLVLECYAVRRAAERKPGPDDLAEVRRIVDEQKSLVGQDEKPKRDADFHRDITKLGGNPVIAEMVERTVRQIEAVQARTHGWVRGEMARTSKSHAMIINAVAKGDVDRADRLMREHLERVRQLVRDKITSVPDTTS